MDEVVGMSHCWRCVHGWCLRDQDCMIVDEIVQKCSTLYVSRGRKIRDLSIST